MAGGSRQVVEVRDTERCRNSTHRALWGRVGACIPVQFSHPSHPSRGRVQDKWLGREGVEAAVTEYAFGGGTHLLPHVAELGELAGSVSVWVTVLYG